MLAQFLEKLRTQFGDKAVIITSGHRPKAVNDTIKGASKTSEHLYNGTNIGAVDVKVKGADC